MRVFLFQTAKGLFASSGGYRANLAVLKSLAGNGHAATQICYAHAGEIDELITRLKEAGVEPNLKNEYFVVPLDDHNHDGDEYKQVSVCVHSFTTADRIQYIALDLDTFEMAYQGHSSLSNDTADYVRTGIESPKLAAFCNFMRSQLRLFQPTHILVNDTLSLKLTARMWGSLHDELTHPRPRRAIIIHTAEQLPFGPFAGGIAGGACGGIFEHLLYASADGVWAVSRAIQDYTRQHGAMETTFLTHHPKTYLLDGENGRLQVPARRRNWGKMLVGVINPCWVKGVTVFVELARKCPEFTFAAWVSWGTDQRVREMLEELPNVEIRPTCQSMEAAWDEMQVLLVPSLWLEAWGLVVTEAQVRGIPVISSDAGALPEAKLGVPHIVPVKPLTGERDEHTGYRVPPQDVEPWVRALTQLLTDQQHYEAVSESARQTTVEWLEGLDDRAHERWLRDMEGLHTRDSLELWS